jgi:glycosyltransferase involved in cell wall biosynthesis
VIGSNTSSVPEVIGRDDALFDPRSDQAITAKMVQVLTDDTFRCALESHGLQQAKVFSWLNTAQCAWDAIRRLSTSAQVLPVAARRPRLAYLSPVPIGKSGIADYSAELLPELARHYQIDVVVCQDEPMQDSWLLANCPVRSVAWFRTHAKYFDRVLYHFGNSHFHGHMFGLLREIPGIVVLHDFFLSGIVAHMDVHRQNPGCWSRALLVSHGWPAVQMRHTVKDTADAVWAYPCNLPVLQNALGVIVHSENSIRLAEHWYGNAAAKNWALVPHMRVPVYGTDKMASRAALAVAFSDFVVCSFGMLGPTKLNHRLLQAWIASPLATSPQCRLVFVGQNDGGEYGIAMVNAIANSRARVTITGWTDVDVYRQWLSTTDVAVQLRTHSRGETSGTVLDCMNFSVATIVNAHGSMRDLPNNAVYKLPDEFTDDQLVDALTELWKNEQHRLNLGQHGRQLILSKHQPRHCADLYKKAIENFDAYSVTGSHGVTNLCGALVTQPVDTNRQQIAQALAINFSPIPRRKQLLLDVTGLVLETKDNDTHRIVRSLLLPLLQHPPAGWQVEPVYAVVHGSGYQYARRFTCGFLGLPSDWTADDVVEAWSGDTFLVLNSHPSSIPPQAAVLEGWHVRGVKLYAVLYDLLPLLLPHAFVDGATQEYQQWLTAIADFDGVLAVSRTVADEFLDWLAAYGRHSRKLPLNVHYFHLGVDVENTSTTTGYLKPAIKALERVALAPTFLMVGTIEPFKGHQLVLDAFNVLWEQGADLNLVIVGKQGCLVEAFIEQLRNHPQIGLHLHWLEGASDECLGTFYDKSTCIIAAGEGVGFDLPLIEAARFKLPIIARDIPIFREVAAEHAFYFPTDANVDSLAQSISQWLVLYRTRSHPVSESMPWMTWSESATQINTILEGVPPYKTWLPDGVTRFWGNDIRLSTQVGLRRGRAMHSSGSEGFLVFGPYRPLAIGQYKVILSGVAKHWTGEETFDMSCTGGDTRLLHAELSAEPIGAWYKEFQFDLSHHVNDLETRLWVTTQTKLCLNSIEIIEIN